MKTQKTEKKKNSLLHYVFPYYFIPFIYVLIFITHYYYLPPMYLITFIFFVLPLCDEYMKLDVTNPTPEEARVMESQLKYKIPLYISVFLEYATVYKTLCVLSHDNIPYFIQFTVLFGTGLIGGSNINIAHELLHKESNPIDSFMGSLALLRNMYQHFIIEHTRGHHKRVATPDDPATSRRGQSLYNFWIQTLIGSYKSAWELEKQRVALKGSGPWTLRNKMVQYLINNIVLCLVIVKFFGLWGLYYYLVCTFISILFLETVNYIEHYGLERRKLPDGKYEKVNILHSWNAPQRMTNYVLFKLQRHSDHHENSQKPYQILISDDKSPMLPNGYILCVIMALFPPLWINVMEDMLKVWHLKNKGQDYAVYWNAARLKVRLFILFLGLVCFAGLYLQVYVYPFQEILNEAARLRDLRHLQAL